MGNYVGPNNGEGIRIFFNEAEMGSDTIKDGGPYPTGDGRIVVGRRQTDKDGKYASVQVDELIFFNQSLSTTDIKLLYNGI